MPNVIETILLLDGRTIKGVVKELGFHFNNYFAKYNEHKLVWKGNMWMEY